MDADDLRAALTVVSFVTFIAIVWWAYSARRKRRFEEEARSIIEDDDAKGERK